MRSFSCLLRLSLPQMDEMAQSFIPEIEWLAVLRCRATGLSTSLFLTERRCSANLPDRRRQLSSLQLSYRYIFTYFNLHIYIYIYIYIFYSKYLNELYLNQKEKFFTCIIFISTFRDKTLYQV